MSRAMNLNITEADAMTICAEMGITTTAIESLIPTGTRVVCKTSVGTLALRNKMRAKIIEGSVKRAPRSVASSTIGL